MFRSKAEQKVADAGYDPARLPPGQYYTEKWPVLHAGTVPETDLSTWDFKVFGEVESPATLTWEQLQELPATEVTTDIHCVTRWTRLDMPWKGVPLRAILELAEPLDSARYVIAHAEQDHVMLEARERQQAFR
jgi:DMSO/TMAO reductase YedYZ molybdopterin-dependent catalytic subunit